MAVPSKGTLRAGRDRRLPDASGDGSGDDSFCWRPSHLHDRDYATEEDVDHYWSALTDGGEAIACGWLKDRYGLRWQVVPSELPALLADPDQERAAHAAQAMMTMKKLDLRAMREAADGIVRGAS